LSATKTRLLIAGKSSDDSLMKMIGEDSLQNPGVSFHPGFVSDSRIQYFINAADVMVFPYRDILNSGALILAMSFGRACVAPRLGAISELLGDRGGVLYDPESPDALLRALKAVVEQKTNITEMGKTNLTAARRWDWNFVGKKTIEVYQGCCKR
jgi:glycosyltransferase involved in cell wall biosynthesis